MLWGGDAMGVGCGFFLCVRVEEGGGVNWGGGGFEGQEIVFAWKSAGEDYCGGLGSMGASIGHPCCAPNRRATVHEHGM